MTVEGVEDPYGCATDRIEIRQMLQAYVSPGDVLVVEGEDSYFATKPVYDIREGGTGTYIHFGNQFKDGVCLSALGRNILKWEQGDSNTLQPGSVIEGIDRVNRLRQQSLLEEW